MNKQHVSLTPKMKEDPVMDCYIALFNAITDREITDINKEVDSRKYLKGLFDKEESQKRIKQIDLMRRIGMKTEAEQMIEHNTRDTRTKVINPYLGEEKIFNTIKEACEEYDINYNNVKEYFFRKKTNKIQYKGLILEKLP